MIILKINWYWYRSPCIDPPHLNLEISGSWIFNKFSVLFQMKAFVFVEMIKYLWFMIFSGGNISNMHECSFVWLISNLTISGLSVRKAIILVFPEWTEIYWNDWLISSKLHSLYLDVGLLTSLRYDLPIAIWPILMRWSDVKPQSNNNKFTDTTWLVHLALYGVNSIFRLLETKLSNFRFKIFNQYNRT